MRAIRAGSVVAAIARSSPPRAVDRLTGRWRTHGSIAPPSSSAWSARWAEAHRSTVCCLPWRAAQCVLARIGRSRTSVCIGREQAMISHQVCPGTRYQRRQTGDDVHARTNVAGGTIPGATEVHGLEPYGSGAVGERALELEDDQAVAIDTQTLRRPMAPRAM
jgi:hypothetical protein